MRTFIRCLLLSLVAAFAPMAAVAGGALALPCAAKFTGAYLGGNVGVVGHAYDIDGFNANSAQEFSADKGQVGVGVGVLGGYDWNFRDCWLAGIQGDFRYNTNASAKHMAGTHSSDTKADWQAGFAVKISWVPMADNLYYALIGPEWVHTKHTYTRTFTGVVHNTGNTRTGFKLGLGASQAVLKNLVLSEEISGVFLNRKTFTHSDGGRTRIHYAQVAGMLSLTYYFRDWFGMSHHK